MLLCNRKAFICFCAIAISANQRRLIGYRSGEARDVGNIAQSIALCVVRESEAQRAGFAIVSGIRLNNRHVKFNTQHVTAGIICIRVEFVDCNVANPTLLPDDRAA